MTRVELDETGRRCPLPIIALGRALHRLPPRAEVLLLADDPVVLTDVPAWCSMVGADLQSIERTGSAITILIRLP